jgi:hypothetical protein
MAQRRGPVCVVEVVTLPSLVTIFAMARLWVRLWWHTVQAWIGGNDDEARAAKEVWRRLVEEGPAAVPARFRHAVREALTREALDWDAEYGSEAYKAKRRDVTSALQRLTPPQRMECRTDFCAALLDPLLCRLAATRKEFKAEQDVLALLAWDLGECIEQGLCPPYVWAGMELTGREMLGLEPLELPECPKPPFLDGRVDALQLEQWETMWREHEKRVVKLAVGRHRRVRRESKSGDPLSDRSFNPGDLPPMGSWTSDLVRLWSRLPGYKAPPNELLAVVGRKLVGNTGPFVEWLAEVVVRELSDIEADESPRGLVFDLERKWIILGRVPYALEKAEVLFVKAVADAGGEWRSKTDLEKAHPVLKDEDIHKLYPKLPPPIRALIETARGKGYRLRVDRKGGAAAEQLR